MNRFLILLVFFFIPIFSLAQTDDESNEEEGMTDYEEDEEYYYEDYNGWNLAVGLVSETFKTIYHLAYKFPNEAPLFTRLEDGGRGFTKYPYHDENLGMYYKPFDRGRRWSGEVRGHYHWGYPTNSLYGEIRVSPIPVFNFDLKYNFFTEILDDGTLTFKDLTTIGITYNRLRHHRINLYWGVGAMTSRDFETVTGLSLLYGCSIYLFKPLSLHYQGQYIWFLNEVPANLHQIFLKLHLKQCYLYIGGQVTNHWDNDSGTMLGIGFHF